eukprot:TRINITY_DN5888_c0_g1_i35.p1 TRINITY_DN5888_c0_g1~~TRINITY_DN5888_c0_g1_i35.p1  ORF type:complete len:275 (-),score=53.31 TRINITY_DN5888_c0_g1_i35:63-887(-)
MLCVDECKTSEKEFIIQNQKRVELKSSCQRKEKQCEELKARNEVLKNELESARGGPKEAELVAALTSQEDTLSESIEQVMTKLEETKTKFDNFISQSRSINLELLKLKGDKNSVVLLVEGYHSEMDLISKTISQLKTSYSVFADFDRGQEIDVPLDPRHKMIPNKVLALKSFVETYSNLLVTTNGFLPGQLVMCGPDPDNFYRLVTYPNDSGCMEPYYLDPDCFGLWSSQIANNQIILGRINSIWEKSTNQDNRFVPLYGQIFYLVYVVPLEYN